MRFLEDGPSIPDDLLVARDEGRVIFFCGAGVSRARARLPDFFELAERVMNGLGAVTDSPARKLVAAAQTMGPIAGVTGVISADRVFSLLEREFAIRDIAHEVAKALRPASDADLSAHKTLLDLSRGPDRKVRLITTNFDLLFEAAAPKLRVWQPPHLPEPTRQTEFDGIVHLHGRVDSSYQGALGDGFVLSSAEFGRAYLSDGWATRFIRALTDQYLVVFLGYTADDPPVQYLLEALNRTPASEDRIFAFQSGTASDAQARWRHKGVQAIAYDNNESHRALWRTLEAWAARARNPARWSDRIIRRAQRGPEQLLPYERGQVVHLISTREGAAKFSSAPKPPPATWLCVFDRACRYATPNRLALLSGDSRLFDPFDTYGLDTDPVPAKIDPTEYRPKRDIPEGVSDAFALTALDRENLRDASASSFRGLRPVGAAAIPPRLGHLATWLANVADQPAAVWWAAGQPGINIDVQMFIQSRLQRPERRCAPAIRRAWQYLFESWRSEASREVLNNYALKGIIDTNGWDTLTVHRYGELCRPYLKVNRPFWTGPKPPKILKNPPMRDLVNIEIDFPQLDFPIAIPDQHLAEVVGVLRQNLVWVASLGGADFHAVASSDIPPIEPDPDLTGLTSTREIGVLGTIYSYLQLFRRLQAIDLNAARIEAQTWFGHTDPIFTRLTIWACADAHLVVNNRVVATLTMIDDDGFWDPRHQRDLLLALEKRWTDLPQPTRKRLEVRLLKGPKPWPGRHRAESERHRANMILDRLYWLHQHGCSFGFDLEMVAAPLKEQAPDWRLDLAVAAAASNEPRGGYLQTDRSYSDLLSVPLDSVLAVAALKRTRDHVVLIEHDPFAGLAAERPVRALGAIRRTAVGQEHVGWAWRTLLSFDARKADTPRLAALLAHRLACAPHTILAEIMGPATFWLNHSRKVLFSADRAACLGLWDRLIGVLEKAASPLRRSSFTGGGREWVTEAINSAAGKLAETLIADPSLTALMRGAGLSPDFAVRAERLLRLGDDARKHTLVILGLQLSWLFAVDAAWTEANVLSVLGQDCDDLEALISGFLHNPRVESRPFFVRLLPLMMELAVAPTTPTFFHPRASDVVLGGWLTVDEDTGERWVSSASIREILIRADNKVRSHTLWQVARWSSLAAKITFLTDVWPRQMVAKSPAITRQLCEIALRDKEHFPELVDALLPLMNRSDRTDAAVPHFDNDARNVLKRFPDKFLTMVWEVLPEDATKWPYGTNEIVDAIGLTDPALVHDPRLSELKRRWNARRL